MRRISAVKKIGVACIAIAALFSGCGSDQQSPVERDLVRYERSGGWGIHDSLVIRTDGAATLAEGTGARRTVTRFRVPRSRLLDLRKTLGKAKLGQLRVPRPRPGVLVTHEVFYVIAYRGRHVKTSDTELWPRAYLREKPSRSERRLHARLAPAVRQLDGLLALGRRHRAQKR